MIQRVVTVVTVIMLLVLTTGCGSVGRFLFGRGARCGSCNRLSSPIQAPVLGRLKNRTQPVLPAPAPVCPAPVCPAPVCQAPVCQAPACQAPLCHAPVIADQSCGCCQVPAPIHNGCGCGGDAVVGPNFPGATINGALVPQDPYLGGGIVGGGAIGSAVPGPILDQGTLGFSQGTLGGPLPSGVAPLVPDGFGPRQLDRDGNRILSVDPLPPGAIPQGSSL